MTAAPRVPARVLSARVPVPRRERSFCLTRTDPLTDGRTRQDYRPQCPRIVHHADRYGSDACDACVAHSVPA